MSFFDSPTSFRLRELAVNATHTLSRRALSDSTGQAPFIMAAANTTLDMLKKSPLPPHASHPNFINLAGLVSEAVLEVVFVALPGFLVAWTGMFDANSQRNVAELNTNIFTPCLIFYKLAGQLNADKLADLAVIPFIFATLTLISYISGQVMSRVFGFGQKKRQKNFILAMAVFGNSNSLPISLVISLSKTISGLHWDKVPGDNDDEVGARGILYLLIFQQLGQLLRWTWGYSVLLKPAEAYETEDLAGSTEEQRAIEEQGRYRDDPDEENSAETAFMGGNGIHQSKGPDSGFSSGSQSPGTASLVSRSEDGHGPDEPLLPATSTMGNNPNNEGLTILSDSPRTSRNGGLAHTRSEGHITTFPNFSAAASTHKLSTSYPNNWKKPFYQARDQVVVFLHSIAAALGRFFSRLFHALPKPIQKVLSTMHYYNKRFWAGVWRQMNPPLWAMLAALIVASIPQLQSAFFTPGTFVNNSVTRAVGQTGNVAVPLILVVLGANLARSTLPQDQLATTKEAKAEESKLLYASIISRMLLPTIFMAPLLALFAKFVPVSILDDPIFVIVCFLLTGAPSALQLAQICQLNRVYMGAMANLLVASYVVVIFPSTLMLVMLALEVVEWAAQG